MTLLQVINTIQKISSVQPNIHSFVGEFLALNDVTAKYSAIILQQRTHRRNNDFMIYSFYLGYADRLNEDKSNEVEVQSTAIQVIDDIVYKLENLNFDCTVGVYNTFTQRFLAEAAGGYVELDIVVPMGECEDDFAKEEKLDTTITENGEYNFIPKGLGFQNVKLNVNVLSSEIKNQTKEELITINNKRYTYTPDKNYTGIGELNVMVQIPEQPIYEEGYAVGKEDGIDEQKRKLADINITQNGTYEKEDGYKSVVVNVPVPEINNQEKSITITENGQTDITPDTNYTGLSKVGINVNVDTQSYYDNGYSQGKTDGKVEGIEEQKSKLTDITINSNGSYSREDGYDSVTVDVPIPVINNQEKNITITQNGQTDITPDTNYTGLSKVGVVVNVDTQSYYDNGYSQGKIDGKTEGIAEQKAKLTDISITENGTYEKEDGYKSVVVNVPSDKKPETELTKTLTANDTYTYTPDEGTVYNKVIITTDIHPTERLTRTYVENNTYIIEGEYNGGEITVNVPSSVPDLRETEINPETTEQIITPDGFDGYNKITVKGVDSSIDSDIKPENIKSGVNILGVEGNLEGVNNQEKSIIINSNGTSSVVPDTGYTGISKINITVNVPTSSGDGIDLTSLGYTAQENTSINTDIRDSIAYSQSLLENYTDDTTYEYEYNMMFAPLFPCGNRKIFYNFFFQCSSLISIPALDTSKGTNFSSMFSECNALTSVPALNTSNGTNFSSMFLDCMSLTSVPTLDTSKGTDFTYMFYYCRSLTSVPKLNTSNGTDFSSMFYGCRSLTSVSALDTSKGTDFSSMFYDCRSLTSVSSLDTSKGTDFNSMFSECRSLTSVPALNTSNGTNFEFMFFGCINLKTVKSIDVSNGSKLKTMFNYTLDTMNLTNITFTGSINVDISFTTCKKLSFNSIKSILNACSKTTNTNTKTVSFNRTIQDQNNELTNLVASCTSKGWIVSGLTITTA